MHDDQSSADAADRLEPAEEALREVLRMRFGPPPGDTDWPALEARVVAAARFRLAARAPKTGWRTPATRWARVAVPAGLAAALLLGAGLVFGGGDGASDDAYEPGMNEVVATAAGAALPSDLLSVTDQQAFLYSVLNFEPEAR